MKLVDKVLKEGTGRGAKWWMDFIGTSISKHCVPLKGHPDLETAKVDLWVSDLAWMLWKLAKPKIPLEVDESIFCSRLLSLIFSLWSCRIIRAKAHDPRRPVKGRKLATQRLYEHQRALLECMTDESRDASFFPKQEWDRPFAKEARYEPDKMELLRQKVGKKRGAR